MTTPRTAVRPPVNEWSTKTYVDERSDKGIEEGGKSTLPGDSYTPGSAERDVLPLPKEHGKGRDNVLPEANYNGPGPSNPSEGEKVPIRTLGKPGEEYGHPYKNNITPRRVEAEALAGEQQRFPIPKQKAQGDKAKLYSHRYYEKNKSEIKERNKVRYDFINREQWYSVDQEDRKDPKTEGKFHRVPGGGVRNPADRAKEWRETHEASVHRVLADFYRETDPPLRKPQDDRPGDTLDLPTPTYGEPYTYPEDDAKMPGHTLDRGEETRGAPGSAKVIPEGFDYENKKASDHQAMVVLSILTESALEASFGSRVAAKMADLESDLPIEVVEKSRRITPKLKRFDAKNGIWHFAVPGSKGQPYRVRLRALRKGNIKSLSKLHIQVDCSCDYWQFQGPEHWAMVGGYLYGKPRGTASDPSVRDPGGNHKVCKHVLATLRVLKEVAFGGNVD